MRNPFAKPARVGPRPYPYDAHPVNRYGVHRFEDSRNESEHVSIGRDGWAPMVYAIALHHLGYGASGTLCRYLDLAGATDGVATLEGWSTKDEAVKKAWRERLQANAQLFEQLELPDSRHTGAQTALANLLFALKPPHQGVVLCCSREYAEWHALPEHKAYYDMLLSRYDWLHEQVAREFQAAGFEVDGPLFKAAGFEALYHDDWDIFNF
jgi:hypothetical protein